MCVETLLGQDAVVALDLAVVTWVSGQILWWREAREVMVAVKVRAWQKKPIVVEAFSTVQGLGVGQTREAVDGGVQVGVANPGALAPLGGLRLGGTAPMSPPASPRWDASDLLDVQVDHMARETSQDRFAGTVGLPSRTGYRLGGHTGDRTTCPGYASRAGSSPKASTQRYGGS